MAPATRIGIDLGGTKIAAVALAADDAVAAEQRTATPHGDYAATVKAICDLVRKLERETGAGNASVGIGIPGSISPATRTVQNANSTWLNGRPLDRDLEHALGREVRLANDANCFALSEAADGAGADADSVFGVILGTGCGGGLVLGGSLIDGPRGIAGEWGHNPLPWPQPDELPGPACWCGRRGCMETWVSGPALAADHTRESGETRGAEEIIARAEAGNGQARRALERHASRLARGLAAVVNLFDPEVIVLGGGLSQAAHLYVRLPELIVPHLFCDHAAIVIRPPVHDDASGARGAARLWDREKARRPKAR